MRYIFKFPDIGEGLEEGKIIEWYVVKGQSVTSGDALCKMETDKVVTDIPTPKTGVIATLYGGIGDTIKVGSALVEIDIEGINGSEAIQAAQDVIKSNSTEAIDEKGFGVVGTIEVAGDGAYLPVSDEANTSDKQDSLRQNMKVLSTPVARAMAKEMGIDINNVKGTGSAGRVTKNDVQSASLSSISDSLKIQDLEEKASVRYQAMSTSRKVIAKNMLRSKQNAVHMSIMDEVDVSELVNARKRLNDALSSQKEKFTYLPFIIKAVTKALRQYPILNAELDMQNERIIYKNFINIGIAMDMDDGLVVPVIKNADKKSIHAISMELRALQNKAKERKLTMEDLKDGSFSITSFGSIGGYFAVPVIAYPQVAILGIGRIVEKPIVRNHEIAIGSMMPISMSVDHRIVDGGEVTRFLNKVLEYLKEPLLLMIHEGEDNAI